jgi:Leucine-rich repeat (LRR) protein
MSLSISHSTIPDSEFLAICDLQESLRCEIGLKRRWISYSTVPGFYIENNHITRLRLPRLNLKRFPSEILNLSYLTDLNLSENQLNSEALSGFEPHLPFLYQLDLANNDLKKFPDMLEFLPSIHDLNLTGNSINKFPPWIEKMTELTHLRLYSNNFQSSDLNLSHFPNLRLLDIGNNQLTQIPESIGSFSSLKYLFVAGNQLKTLPPQLSQLDSLQMLDISRNLFHSIPECLQSLPNIQHFNASDNKIRRIPKWMGDWMHLKRLQLSSNSISIIHADLSPLRKLHELDLRSNKIKELDLTKLPSQSLKSLNLGMNPMKSLPPQIVTFTNLTSFNWTTIHPGVKSMVIFERFAFYNLLQALSPEILRPISYRVNNRHIYSLNLSNLEIDRLPEKIRSFPYLEHLNLSKNPFGTVPQILMCLPRLKSLNLNSTNLEKLPEWIDFFRELEHLDINENYLQDLPFGLASLPCLTAVDGELNRWDPFFSDFIFVSNPERIAQNIRGMSEQMATIFYKIENNLPLNRYDQSFPYYWCFRPQLEEFISTHPTETAQSLLSLLNERHMVECPDFPLLL